MAQSGGLMVPPQLAKLPSEVAREQLETDQRDAMSAAQQLGWVPKLYYWIKQKYSDIGGCDLTEDPIWLLGVCHHIRRDASAPAPATGAFSRLHLRWRDPHADAEASDRRAAARPLIAPDPSAVWQWFRSETLEDEDDGDEEFAPYADEEAVVDGSWVAYTPEETARLEAAYAAGQKTVDIQGRWYVFLQEPMQQQAIDRRLTSSGGGGDSAADGGHSSQSQAPRAVRRKAASSIEISPSAAADAHALTLSGGSGGDSTVEVAGSERLLPGWGNFLEHVVSRIWCTYREGFSPVGPPIYTSDAGWGCMLRTAQMMLAQSLVRLRLGDAWLLNAPSSTSTTAAGSAGESGDGQVEDLQEFQDAGAGAGTGLLSPYRQLLRLFGDEKLPSCPYSLQYMVQVGGEFGMSTGQWYGPALAARVLERLVNSHPDAGTQVDAGASGAEQLKVWVATDSMGTIYKDAIKACAAGHTLVQPQQGEWQGQVGSEPEPEPEPEPNADPDSGGDDCSSWRHPVLLLLPLKLGLDRHINPRYVGALAAVFRLPQSVGFIGGSPSSSYYFIAAQPETEPAHAHVPATTGGRAGGDAADAVAKAAAAAAGGSGTENSDAKTTVVYLDPHSVQPVVDVSASGASTESYHCRSLRTMRLAQVDPSLTIGFLVRTEEAFDALCDALPSTVGGEICAVFDTEPSADYAYDETLTQLVGGGLGGDDDDDDDMVLL